jgi:2-oxoisovalerate dehydrogenase E2 component (dihydrolipoyl transacylase)
VIKQFKLPDVGEGLTEGEILKWHVQPGDTVAVNQTIVEIETAKAAVELPSPWAGVVAELLAVEGDTVDVGAPIISIETEPSAAGQPATLAAPAAPVAPVATPQSTPPAQAAALQEDMVPQVPSPQEDAAVEPGMIGGPAPGGRTSVLVGYGPRTGEVKRRPRRAQHGAVHRPAAPTEAAPVPGGPLGTEPAKPVRHGGLEVGRGIEARESPYAGESPYARQAVPPRAGEAEAAEAGRIAVLAKPPVRKLAKDLGVDLRTVTPSGPGGTVTRADVHAAAGVALEAAPREERVLVKGVRKMTAQAMVASAFTAPHVTEFLTVDVTRTMELIERLRRHPDFAGVKVSPLLIVAKALILAVRRTPEVNASWDEERQEIVLKRYVNLGIAAATGRGLIVPNVKNADSMTLPDLARALAELVATAREGRTAPADMTGGTITITNVGVFGVDTGTPIINPGESAILAFGAVRWLPWVVDGQVVPRQVTTLALSFDHRIVDGEQGSRCLADVAAILEDPALGLLA